MHRIRLVCTALVVAALGMAMPTRAASTAAPCERMTFESSVFVVCTFDSTSQELHLAWTGGNGTALRGFAALKRALGADAARVRFAMNAGMFDDRGGPVGLYVENGTERHAVNTNDGEGNFHLKPNGVFWMDRDRSVHVDATENYLALDAKPIWATQSGPMLVIGGNLHPAISFDGDSRHVRNGVGIRDAHTAMFAISEGLVSFGRLARVFRDGLHCANALYFDGSISTLWAPALGRQDRRNDLGPMVVVLDRN